MTASFLSSSARPLAAILLLVGASACGLSKRPVPPGYTPLDAMNKASLPMATATDMHPETLNIVKGHDDMNNWDWADGQGYVHASIKDVWLALQDPDVVADRRELSSWKITAMNTDATADVSYTLTCVTKEASLTYTVGWRSFATQGTRDAPTDVSVRGDLIQSASIGGVDVMALLSDSVELTPVDASTTAFAMIRHRDSFSSSPEAVAQFVSDVYANTVAKVHGQALPTFN